MAKLKVQKDIHEVTEGFLIGGIEFLENSKQMEFSYRVSSQTAEIFKIKVENFNLILNIQDISDSFNEKKQTLKIISSLFKLNLDANQKLLSQHHFTFHRKHALESQAGPVHHATSRTQHGDQCKCQACYANRVKFSSKIKTSLNNLHLKEVVSEMRRNSKVQREAKSRGYQINCAKTFHNFKSNWLQKKKGNCENLAKYEMNCKKESDINKGLTEKSINVVKRKSFFMQRKKNRECEQKEFERAIFENIKKKSRGFSSMNYSVFPNVQPKKNGYFYSFRPKSKSITETENRMAKSLNTKKNSSTFGKSKNSKLGKKSIDHSSFKNIKIRLMSARLVKKRKEFKENTMKNIVLFHKKIDLLKKI